MQIEFELTQEEASLLRYVVLDQGVLARDRLESGIARIVLVWTGISGSMVLPASAGCAGITPTAANTKPARASRFRFLIDTWSPDATAVTFPPKSLADSPLRRRQLIWSRILSFFGG